MMSMQVEHGRDLSAVRQRSTTVRAVLGAEGGHSGFAKFGALPSRHVVAERQIGATAFLRSSWRQAVGCSGGRAQRGVPDRRLMDTISAR